MTKRREFTKKIKRLATKRAGGRCESCGTADGSFEHDHSVCCWAGGDNSLGNCVYLCAGHKGSCHAVKTRKDKAEKARQDRLEGRINAKSGKPVRAQCRGTHANKGKLRSRGFDKTRRKRMNGTVEVKT